MQLARPEDPVILERRQAVIAAQSGRVAKALSCGRLVAEIEPDAFAQWEQQRPGFFKKENDGLDYLLKHFPSVRVHTPAKPGLQTRAMAENKPGATSGYRVTGRRGRWAA